MKFMSFIDPGGSQEPPAFAPGVVGRASMEIVMPIDNIELAKKELLDWEWCEGDFLETVQMPCSMAEMARAAMIAGGAVVLNQLSTDFQIVWAEYVAPDKWRFNGIGCSGDTVLIDDDVRLEWMIEETVNNLEPNDVPQDYIDHLANFFEEMSKKLKNLTPATTGPKRDTTTQGVE